jgi:hypothetical protein
MRHGDVTIQERKGARGEEGEDQGEGGEEARWLDLDGELDAGATQSKEKLVAYKKESEWHWVIVINSGHTNGFQATKYSGSGPKQKYTAGWSSTSGSTPSFCA